MKLLILDDDRVCLEVMAHYFTAQGFDLQVASELDHAEVLLSGGRFDAVITDVRLSTLHPAEGLLLLDFIRERAPDTRVVVVTAYDNKDIREEAKRRGAEHFFVKPVPLERVAALLALGRGTTNETIRAGNERKTRDEGRGGV